MAVQLPLPLCTQFFWHAVTASISPDRESREHDTISYLLLLSWLFKERQFPLDDARKESVSAKVLCVGTTVNINSLPHKYPGKYKWPQGDKTTLEVREFSSSPTPSSKGINKFILGDDHLSVIQGGFLWWGIFLCFSFQVISLPFNSFPEC